LLTFSTKHIHKWDAAHLAKLALMKVDILLGMVVFEPVGYVCFVLISLASGKLPVSVSELESYLSLTSNILTRKQTIQAQRHKMDSKSTNNRGSTSTAARHILGYCTKLRGIYDAMQDDEILLAVINHVL
jgi:hypothetical protein